VVDVLNMRGDICHLCRTPVDITVSVPDPRAPTIDHVLPLSRGGGDDLTNVDIAHFACNRRKGAKIESALWTDDVSSVPSVDDSTEAKRQLMKQTDVRRCRWCRRQFAVEARPGRKREFCKPGCRQMDYEARRRAAELGLSENELVMTRVELEQLRDALYVVEAAVEDVDRDLSTAGDDPDEVRRALDWLLQAVRPLLQIRP
jgi:hypothetical protein